MADVNKVWLSGVVINQPVLTRLGSKTPFASFTLLVNERFKNREGIVQTKDNLIRIESLGKGAETTVQRVKQGQRFMIDGYLRQDVLDGIDSLRVRTFAVYPDESAEQISHREGIKQALEILKKSRDLNSAIERLEELVT